MRRRIVGSAAVALIVAACASPPAPSQAAVTTPSTAAQSPAAAQSAAGPSSSAAVDAATAAYLAHLDLAAIQDAAADYAAPVRPSGDPNAFVRTLEDRYRGVDRIAVLREVFRRLTAGSSTGTEKEQAILGFVQHLSVHDFASSLMGLPIFDPVILFDVHAMDCQKASRLVADLYAASGSDSRIVDFYGHAVAEVRYDGGWHYADADMFGGGQVVMINGRIPSVAELAHDPQPLDRETVYLENDVLASYPGAAGKNGGDPTLASYPSTAYFDQTYFADHSGYPAYVSRKAMPAAAPDPAMDFGWNDPAQLDRSVASDITLGNFPSRPSPGPPSIEDVSVGSGSIRLRVAPSGQAPAVAYRVFVSSASRGWDYGAFLGSSAAAGSWANPGGWTPSMYDRLFALPAHVVTTVDGRGPDLRVDGLGAGSYFVSVMPVDRYGLQIGRDLAPLSNELRIVVPG